MIKTIRHQDIDFEKYNLVVNQSCHKKSYAKSHYLEAVCGKQWDILVYDDYKAVMPIPYIKKLGFRFVLNPKLCQQLGVFSKEDDLRLNELFLEHLKSNFRVWYYAFNDTNQFNSELRQRNNFLIPINQYEIVRQKYSPKRKRKLRLDQEVLAESQQIYLDDFNLVQDFIAKNFTGVSLEKDIKDFIKIFKNFHDQNNIKFYAFYYKNIIINMIAVYADEDTAYLLGTFNHKDYVKLAGASVLIDEFISENIDKIIFDFEGSDLPNVEEFFRGFRPEFRPYKCISNSKLDLIKNFIK